MIAGYILVMVTILSTGEVTGEALDYFNDPHACWQQGVWEEIIEEALRAKAGRRGLAIANGETSPQLKAEMLELQNVLGRIHEQKNFYAKFKDGKPYVSG